MTVTEVPAAARQALDAQTDEEYQRALDQFDDVWRAAVELERMMRAKYPVEERREALEIARRSLTERERLLDRLGRTAL